MENNITPLFSVVIPTYNHGHLINKCIDSLIAQTCPKWEAIIVNNFSSDHTIEILDAYKDPRIKLINYSNNGIIAASRNVGIKHAIADWICFLDSDDWWYSDKLQTCITFLNDFDVIYHDLRTYNSEGKLHQVIKGRNVNKDAFVDLVVNRNAIPNSSVIVKKELIYKVGFVSEEKELVAVEDYDLWIRIARLTNKFYYLPVELGAYFISGNNISNDFEKRNVREMYIFNKYKNSLNPHNIKIGLVNMNFMMANNYLISNNSKYRKNLIFILINGKLGKKIKALFFLFFGKTYIKYYTKQLF